MSKVKALVPKLRFPAFRDAAGWEIKPFSKLFSIGNGRDHKHLSPGDIPVYGSGGYMRSVDEYLYDGESVCIGRKGTINNPMFLTGKFWTVDTLFYTHSFNQCLPKFIFSIFQSIDWLKHNEAGGVPSLSKTNIEKIETAVPSLPEQQKIAECLSSVDELIAAQARKLDALKTHKKGLMQQLFPTDGETQPRLRFPEFQDAGEWAKNKLGDVASFFKGKGISKADIAASGRHPCIRYGELYTRYGEVINEIISRTDVADADLFFSQSNDVIIPASGETKLDIAKASCVMHDDVALGGDLNVIRTGHNGVFLSYYLNGPKRLDIAKVAQGDTVVHLYPSQLEKLGVFLPEIHEQQRIADCLTSLDDLIAAQTQKLDALKTHKKGLMQQLFPSAQAVEA
jgi:type I restriction enzyme S subunit